MYESWSLSMFNTLFTSLPVICVGMFDKDLKPATLLGGSRVVRQGETLSSFQFKTFLRGWCLQPCKVWGFPFYRSTFGDLPHCATTQRLL